MKNYAVVMYDKTSGSVLTQTIRHKSALWAVRQVIRDMDEDGTRRKNIVIVDVLDHTLKSMLERISAGNEWFEVDNVAEVG